MLQGYFQYTIVTNRFSLVTYPCTQVRVHCIRITFDADTTCITGSRVKWLQVHLTYQVYSSILITWTCAHQCLNPGLSRPRQHTHFITARQHTHFINVWIITACLIQTQLYKLFPCPESFRFNCLQHKTMTSKADQDPHYRYLFMLTRHIHTHTQTTWST